MLDAAREHELRFLIVGCGSMGKRRARCLRQLGYANVAAVDVREDRRQEIVTQSEVDTHAGFDEALAAGADFALVCLPPHLHADYLMRCIDAGVPAFCEAPLALTLAEADAVIEAAEAKGVVLAPSCTYLHKDIHQTIKEYVHEERLGRPLAAVSYVGQHVADWHPYEDYRDFYASKRSQGGMGLDMLPHDLHLFTDFFGEVRALNAMARRRATDIEADPDSFDAYDAVFDMEAGVTLTLHQDMFQRPWGCYRKIAFERGAIEWDWQSLRVCEYTGPQFGEASKWRDVPHGEDFEAMYVDEIAHVLSTLDGRVDYRMPPRRERRILEVILACEESSRSGRRIDFER